MRFNWRPFPLNAQTHTNLQLEVSACTDSPAGRTDLGVKPLPRMEMPVTPFLAYGIGRFMYGKNLCNKN